MSSKFLSAVFVTLVGLLGVAGCSLVTTSGTGAVTIETRDVGPFDRIAVSNGLRVTVQAGPVQSLQIEAHENLHAMIATTVDGGLLDVSVTGSFLATPAPHVTVVLPSLTAVSASGGSNVTASGIAGDTFRIDLGGGARVTATGAATAVAINSSGGSRAEAFGLTAVTVALDISGGSTVQVHASGEVSGGVSGASSATVAGGATITATASGASTIATQ